MATRTNYSVSKVLLIMGPLREVPIDNCTYTCRVATVACPDRGDPAGVATVACPGRGDPAGVATVACPGRGDPAGVATVAGPGGGDPVRVATVACPGGGDPVKPSQHDRDQPRSLRGVLLYRVGQFNTRFSTPSRLFNIGIRE